MNSYMYMIGRLTDTGMFIAGEEEAIHINTLGELGWRIAHVGPWNTDVGSGVRSQSRKLTFCAAVALAILEQIAFNQIAYTLNTVTTNKVAL